MPKEEANVQNPDWKTDLKSMMRPQVLLGFLTTILGYAGVFAVFTYIAPILTQISGFKESAVSPILLLFGLGLVGGNLLGGKLADKSLLKTVIGTLFALALTLGFMSIGMHHKILSIILVALLGAAAFATVAPLQMWVLSKAVGAGQGLASSLNIAAFNLGNAVGACLGGVVIDHGPGLNSLFLIAAVLPLIAIGVIGFSTQVMKTPASTH